MKYEVYDNKLKIQEIEIVFDYSISNVIEMNDMLIVHLYFKHKIIPIDENVFGVSISEKKIKWQIIKRQYPNGGYKEMRCPFTQISVYENRLRLHNWCSTILIVDPISGAILEVHETR